MNEAPGAPNAYAANAELGPARRARASHFAHSRAVVIGIDRYQHIRPLSTAVSDAARLATFLREQHGYDDVLLLEDATRATLATELGERLAARTGEDDCLLLYFAGHGIALDGDDVLVTGSVDVDGDGVEDTVVEPAHDALVAAWDKLLQWKRQAEEFLPLQRRLWQAASEWHGAATDRQRGLLWDANPRLPQLEETLWPTHGRDGGLAGRTRWARQVLWPKAERPANMQWLNRVEVAFVQASVRRRASGLRRIIAATSAVIIVLALALAFADGQRRTAESERTTNLARFFASESQNSTDADLRTLLGIEAVRLLLDNAIKPLSDDVWSALHAAVAESPGLSLDIDEIELGATGSISFVQNWLAPDSAEWLAVLRHGTGPGAAKLVDLRARQILHLPELPDDAWRFVFGPTGQSVAAIVEKSVQVLSTAGIAPVCSLTHHSYINELAFDPSNTKLLITGGATAALWDIGRCKQMSLLPIPADEHGFAVTRLQFSDDGIHLYAFDESMVEQWDITNAQRPQLIRKFEGHSVSLSENLDRVAVSLNGIVQILDTSDSQPIWTKQITGADRQVSVHLSPDGRHVLTTQSGRPGNRNLTLWQVDDGVELWHWERRSMFATPLWISRANDTLLLTYEDKGDTLHLLNLNTGEAHPSSPHFRGAEIARVVAHPAGTHLLIQLNDDSIRLWNLQGGYEEKKLANGAEVLADMAFAPDGSFAATLSRNGTFRTWSTSPPEFLSTDQKPKLLKLVDSVAAIGELPSGDLAIDLLDQLAIRGQAVISVSGEISSMDAGGISGHLLLDSYDSDIPISTRALYHLQDTGSLTVELLTRLPPNLYLHSDCQPCISSDGRWLALLDDPSYDQTSSGGAETIAATCEGSLTCVLIWDVNASQVRAALHHEAEIAVNGIAFNPAAAIVATYDTSDIMRLWDIQSQDVQPIVLTTAYYLPLEYMAFTSDGQRLVARGSFGSLHVWDVDSRRLVKEHNPETPEDQVSPRVAQFRFVSDSNDIVVLVSPNCGSQAPDPGSMPGVQIQRWHIDTLQPIGAQLNSQGDCNALFDVVTLDDRLLVGVSTPQNTIEVFDYSAGTKLFSVTTPLPVIDIALAPGGEYLAAIDQEGRVHQWPIDLQHLLQTACALVGREMQKGERDLYFGEAAPPRTTCEGINP